MPLKLAIVTAFPKDTDVIRGGVESVSYCLAIGLRDRSDIEIHIVAPSNGSEQGVDQQEGLWIHWVPTSNLPGFLDYWTIFRWRAQRIIKGINPDITHFQGLAGWVLGFSQPYVLTIHGIAEKDILHKGGLFLRLRRYILAHVERHGRKQAPHIIAINPYVLTELGDQLKGVRWNIENPVETEFFSVTGGEEGSRILYVGRVSALKNIEGLLRSFATVRADNHSATLHIAGEAEASEYMERCVRLVKQLGIESSVSFLGNLSRTALRSQLRQARCLVLVAKQENAPMVIAEAMAAGVPVVASRICGIPYMVRDGETGFLVDPANTDEIANRLSFILDNPAVAIKMGQLAKTVAFNRFHVHTVAEKTIAVYEKILAEKNTRDAPSE